MAEDLIEILSTLQTFRGIPKELIPAHISCSGSFFKSYQKDEILLFEDDLINYAGLLVTGSLHMFQENSKSASSLMLILKPGEYFGESYACGNNKIARMGVKVAEPSTVLYMPYQKIINGCEGKNCPYNKILVSNMAAILADKNVRLMERMQALSQGTIREKILVFCGIEMERLEKLTGKPVNCGDWFTLPYNRTLLAKYLCVDRTALARELSAMKAQGIIDFDSKRIKVL